MAWESSIKHNFMAEINFWKIWEISLDMGGTTIRLALFLQGVGGRRRIVVQ